MLEKTSTFFSILRKLGSIQCIFIFLLLQMLLSIILMLAPPDGFFVATCFQNNIAEMAFMLLQVTQGQLGLLTPSTLP